MLQEILVKLPIKDVLRSSRVSRLWRSVVSDPSFRNLHADTYVAPLGDTESLLVSVRSVPGQMDEASVFNVSSGKAMCSFPIPSHYGLANVCNGLLCFAYHRDGSRGSAPAIVCNPATGERLTLPKPPAKDKVRMFALGFSAPTKEYKLFCLSYPPHSDLPEASVKVHVYTLGDARGWRRHSFHSPSRPVDLAAPVLIDGMLYVMTIGWQGTQLPTKLLVVNVSTETMCYTCHLPAYNAYDESLVGIYEVGGRLCFLAHASNPNSRVVHCWVMSPSRGDQHFDHNKLTQWDPLYRFKIGPFYPFRPWIAWFEGDKMFCYITSNTLHNFDLTERSMESVADHGQTVLLDQQLKVPATSPKCKWHIYGGYRPTLFSPLTFALPSSNDDDNGHESRHQFELARLHKFKGRKQRRFKI
jgi:F-box interacting protein